MYVFKNSTNQAVYLACELYLNKDDSFFSPRSIMCTGSLATKKGTSARDLLEHLSEQMFSVKGTGAQRVRESSLGRQGRL